jgi:hypothetical protein
MKTKHNNRHKSKQKANIKPVLAKTNKQPKEKPKQKGLKYLKAINTLQEMLDEGKWNNGSHTIICPVCHADCGKHFKDEYVIMLLEILIEALQVGEID